MAHEGTLWFSDLTTADPTLIIPFAVGIFNLANIEVSKTRNYYHEYIMIIDHMTLVNNLVIMSQFYCFLVISVSIIAQVIIEMRML